MASAAIRAAMMSNSGEGLGNLDEVQTKIQSYHENPAFTTWLFDGMSLGDAGSAMVAAALEKEVSVTTVHLSDNMIGDIGATAISKALETNKTVQHLFVNENRIGDPGASAFATALEHNETLLTLSLASNQVKDTGAQSISNSVGMSLQAQREAEQRTGRVVKQNGTLIKLYLNGACSARHALGANATA